MVIRRHQRPDLLGATRLEPVNLVRESASGSFKTAEEAKEAASEETQERARNLLADYLSQLVYQTQQIRAFLPLTSPKVPLSNSSSQTCVNQSYVHVLNGPLGATTI